MQAHNLSHALTWHTQRHSVVGYLLPAEGVATMGATSPRAIFEILTYTATSGQARKGYCTLTGEVCTNASEPARRGEAPPPNGGNSPNLIGLALTTPRKARG